MVSGFFRLCGVMAVCVWSCAGVLAAEGVPSGESHGEPASMPVMTLASFAALPARISAQGWAAEETLIVLDNDDTLSRMPCPVDSEKLRENPENCQYIGGPAWFSWQESLLPASAQPVSEECEKYCAATSFPELLDVTSYLFAASKMEFAEAGQAAPLSAFAAEGMRLMVLTARGSAAVSSTEMQLSNLALPVAPGGSAQSLLELISQTAPRFSGAPFSGDIASAASPFFKCASSNRAEDYRNGIFYAAGQDKGEILQCFLKAYAASAEGHQRPVKNIVFIDDTKSNVVSVNAAMSGSKDYRLAAYHYTYLQKHKARLTEPKAGKPYRDMAAKRWRHLVQALEQALLQPSVSK